MTEDLEKKQALDAAAQAQARADNASKTGQSGAPQTASQSVERMGTADSSGALSENDGRVYDNPVQKWFQTSFRPGLTSWQNSGDKIIDGISGLQDTPDSLFSMGEEYVFKLFNWDFWDKSKKFMDFETANKNIQNQWGDVKNKTAGNANQGVVDGFTGLAETIGLTSLLNACGINITTPEQEAAANANVNANEEQAVANNLNASKHNSGR